MPREQKKRGRRGDNKRKHDEEQDQNLAKRPRIQDEFKTNEDIIVDGDAGDDFISFGLTSEPPQPGRPEQQFYGLLDEEEQEYYANVNNKISANDFESDEDRTIFIEAVHRESNGKEIKLASSQSCSRYLEKIIQLSTKPQLESLFSAFLSDLNYLVQHRFGSHCCEALFLQAARHVQSSQESSGDEDSVENLFLRAAEELKPNIGYLLTERFASHAVRVLLLVLSGENLEDTSIQRMLASQKKEKHEVQQEVQSLQSKRTVPEQFKQEMSNMIEAAVSSLDTTYLRALATHPTGNPVLQLLLRLELGMSSNSSLKKQGTLYKKLLPDEEFDPESESVKFLTGLVYDPTGSHLVEVLVQNLPGKAFKKMYKNMFKERMGRLARNDIAGYVVVRILERVGKDDLAESMQQILKELPSMVERRRLVVIRSLVERCEARNLDASALATAIREAFGKDSKGLLPELLQLSKENATTDSQNASAVDPSNENQIISRANLQGSLLAQSMLRVPSTSEIIQESILAQPDSVLLSFAKDPVSSRVLQVAFKSPAVSTTFRRQLIPRFYEHIADLAIHPAGSHVADALWDATTSHGAHFMKERLAQELKQNEAKIRDSRYGRTVWKNWAMDVYLRRPREWQAIAKSSENNNERQQQEQDKNHKNQQEGTAEPKKSAIQLARERHVQKQARAQKQQQQQDRNANTVPIVSANA